VGLILDLAVAALVVVVLGSLGMLAWTLAVSSVAATRRARLRVANARREIDRLERELHDARARTLDQLERLTDAVNATSSTRSRDS
jgi:hypothetical protein